MDSKLLRAIMEYCGSLTDCLEHYRLEPDTLICNLEDITGIDMYEIEKQIKEKIIGFR